MKRLCLILVLIVGCATAPAYQGDPVLKKRANSLAIKTMNCVAPSTPFYLVVSPNKEVNAFIDYKPTLYLTEGLMNMSDETIMLVVAHEFSHIKLGHVYKKAIVTYGITGVMLASNLIIPGLGHLNHIVNPAITNNYGKVHELDADRLAVESCIRCFGFTKEQSIEILKSLSLEGGGFWDSHPSLQDRVENISKLPHLPGQTVSESAPPSGTIQEKPSQQVQPSGLFDSPFLKQTPRIQ
jgi:predicted Zn-dependent protease